MSSIDRIMRNGLLHGTKDTLQDAIQLSMNRMEENLSSTDSEQYFVSLKSFTCRSDVSTSSLVNEPHNPYIAKDLDGNHCL